MNELFHYVMKMDLDTFLRTFNQFNIEDKREYLARVHFAYTERRVFLECVSNQIFYIGLSLEEEFKTCEYRYRLQFQTDICLQTSANYLYLNMIKLEEYYLNKLIRD
jgi:hypothetical protein